MRARKPNPVPTWTSLVEEALLVFGSDLLTIGQVCTLTGATGSQAGAALAHLAKHGVVQHVSGRWHHAGADDRSHTMDQRAQEEPGTRRVRPRQQPQPNKEQSHGTRA